MLRWTRRQLCDTCDTCCLTLRSRLCAGLSGPLPPPPCSVAFPHHQTPPLHTTTYHHHRHIRSLHNRPPPHPHTTRMHIMMTCTCKHGGHTCHRVDAARSPQPTRRPWAEARGGEARGAAPPRCQVASEGVVSINWAPGRAPPLRIGSARGDCAPQHRGHRRPHSGCFVPLALALAPECTSTARAAAQGRTP